MDNISKIRTLLDMAREALVYHINEAEQRHEKERLIRPDRDIVARIDAALAEPVEGPLNAISRLQQQLHEAKSNADWLVQQAQRERDEARAEVRRTYKELSESIAREAEAYERGAEAMREAAALCAEREETQLPLHVASAIRALPIPEDK